MTHDPNFLPFDRFAFAIRVKEKMFSVMSNRQEKIGLREFSKLSGVSSSTLSRICNGAPPDIDTFFLLCEWIEENPLVFRKDHALKILEEGR